MTVDKHIRIQAPIWRRSVTALILSAALGTTMPSLANETPDGKFTPNFNNVDIHTLIGTIAKYTGRNFVVDPRVKARVSVVSSTPMDGDQLYDVFLSVLQVHNFAAVPTGDVIKIVPDVAAKQGSVPSLSSNGSELDQLVTHVFKVNNVPAAQLVPILRPLIPQQGHLAAYTATNSLIIADRTANINRIAKIIARVDRPDSDEIEIVRVHHASAAEMVRILTALLNNNPAASPTQTRLSADERTNSVLVSGDKASRLRVRGLIANLDTPLETGGNTRVVYLHYAVAKEMAEILKGVSLGQAQVGVSALDVASSAPPSAEGGTANPSPRTPPQNGNKAQPTVDIQADEHTNSLIITAPPGEMKNILAVIRQLDIRRAQVMVEAIIAELTEAKTRELGSNLVVNGANGGEAVGLTNMGSFASEVGGLATGGTFNPGRGISTVLGQVGKGSVDWGFLIRAIASDSKNNILSTPSLVTLDNQEAEIVVGQNVPFVTGTSLSSSNSNPFQTIERQDIGLTLKVKPQINEGNTVKLDIAQEVSDLVQSTDNSGAADLITTKRSINTVVLVEDNQTLVLGGLIDEDKRNSFEKVPLLGDIPILGNLFQYKTATSSKSNLMVFIRPTILRDAATGSLHSNAKYNFIRAEQLDRENLRADLINQYTPILPELNLIYQAPTQKDEMAEALQGKVINTDYSTPN